MKNIQISGQNHTPKAEGTDPAAMAVPQPNNLLDNWFRQEDNGSECNQRVRHIEQRAIQELRK
jgi:hypothetical protein